MPKKASRLNVFTRIFGCVFVKYKGRRSDAAAEEEEEKELKWLGAQDEHERAAVSSRGRRHRLVPVPKCSWHRHFHPLKHWNRSLCVAVSAVCFFFFSCACEMSPSWCQTFLDEAYSWDRCNSKTAWRKIAKARVTEALLSHIISSDVAPTGERSILTASASRWFCCRKCLCFSTGLWVSLNNNPLCIHLHILYHFGIFFFSRILFRFNLLRLLEHIQNVLLQSCATGQNECDANMSSTL